MKATTKRTKLSKVQQAVRLRTIIVNGRERDLPCTRLSYDELVMLSYGPSHGAAVFTVTYSKGPPKQPAGSLVQGEFVALRDGMIFNVAATNRA